MLRNGYYLSQKGIVACIGSLLFAEPHSIALLDPSAANLGMLKAVYVVKSLNRFVPQTFPLLFSSLSSPNVLQSPRSLLKLSVSSESPAPGALTWNF